MLEHILRDLLAAQARELGRLTDGSHRQDTERVDGMVRQTEWFDCAKCGKRIPDYLTFGVGDRDYCLETCVPRWTRIKMWFRERFGRP